MTPTSPQQGSGTPWLHVDLDALQAVHARLRTLAGDLARLEPGSSVASADYGNEAVRRAVGGFLEDWKDGRNRIGERLDEIVDVVALAVQAYGNTDRTVHNAARGPSDGAPAGGRQPAR